MIFLLLSLILISYPVSALSLSGIVNSVSKAAGSVVNTVVKTVGTVISAVTSVISKPAANKATTTTNNVINSVNKATGSTTTPIIKTNTNEGYTGADEIKVNPYKEGEINYLPSDSLVPDKSSDTQGPNEGGYYPTTVIPLDPLEENIPGGDMLYYDVDITDINLECPSCPIVDGLKVFIPGFRYVVVLTIHNDGNVPASNVTMKVKVTEPTHSYEYNFLENKLSVNYQNELIPFITREPISVNDLTTYLGKEKTFNIAVEVILDNDKAVISPTTSTYIEFQKVCKWVGLTYPCMVEKVKHVKECCNTLCQICSEEPGCLNLDKCKTQLIDTPIQNTFKKSFEINMITPYLASQSGLGLI